MLLLDGSQICDEQALLAHNMNRYPSALPALSSSANGCNRSLDSKGVPSIVATDGKRSEVKRPSPTNCIGGSENRDPNRQNSSPLCSLKRKLNNPPKTGAKVYGQNPPNISPQDSSSCENDCASKQAGQAFNFDIVSPPRKHVCNSRRCASKNPHYALPVQVQPRKYLMSKRHLSQARETSVCECCLRKAPGNGGACSNGTQKQNHHNCRVARLESSSLDCPLLPLDCENAPFVPFEGDDCSNEESKSREMFAPALEAPLKETNDVHQSHNMSLEVKSPVAPFEKCVASNIPSIQAGISSTAAFTSSQEAPQEHRGVEEHNTEASPSCECNKDCTMPGDQLDPDISRQPNQSAEISSDCGIFEDVREYEPLDLPTLISGESNCVNTSRDESSSIDESAQVTGISRSRVSFHYHSPQDVESDARNDHEAGILMQISNLHVGGFKNSSLTEGNTNNCESYGSERCAVVDDTRPQEALIRDKNITNQCIEPACIDQNRDSPRPRAIEVSVGAELELNTRCSSSSPCETVLPQSPQGVSGPEPPELIEKSGNWRLNAVLEAYQNLSPTREGRVKTLVRAFESLLSVSEIGVQDHRRRGFPLQFSYHTKKSEDGDGSSRDGSGQSDDSGEERLEESGDMSVSKEPSGFEESRSGDANDYEGMAETADSSGNDDTGSRITTEIGARHGHNDDDSIVDKLNTQISRSNSQFRFRKKPSGKQYYPVQYRVKTKPDLQDHNRSSLSTKNIIASTTPEPEVRESPSKSKSRRPQNSETQSRPPKGSFCKPQPFKLRTQERGQMKEHEFLMRLKTMLAEEERLRIPLAQGLPWTTDEPEVLLKPAVKDSTIPIDLYLNTEFRAMERAEFDSFIAEKLLYLEQRRLDEERLRQIEEEEEIKKIRKEMVPRAQLMPYFDRPFRPRRSSKRPTIPKEPHFNHAQAKRPKCTADVAGTL